jgi:outer membrane protein assembly factor BamB
MRPLLRALLLVGLACAPAAAQLANTPWPKFQHDAQNTGRSTLDGPAGPAPIVAWEYANSVGRTAVTVGTGGVIYVGDGKKPITALSRDGDVLWFMSNGRIAGQAAGSTPALGANGAVYMGERGNNLWAADADDGGIQWKFFVPTDGDVRVSPTIGPDGTVFMGSSSLGAGNLYALNPDGTVKWVNRLGENIDNLSPALSQDAKTLYVGYGGVGIAAFDAQTGNELWRSKLSKRGPGGAVANRSVVIGANGTLYFAARDGVFAVDPDPNGTGEVLWQFSAGPLIFQSCPALGADGTLYVGASGLVPTFYAINPNGTERWSYIMGSRGRFMNNQAVIGGNGTVYVTFDHGLYSFTAGGDGNGVGILNWTMGFARRFKNGPSIGDANDLYVVNGFKLFRVVD